MPDNSSPIGLFDSGVGGLTVAAAIRSLLPDERMIYFGDTAHLPYGDKSRETIIRYSLEIVDYLLEKNCKVILIACNSASSNAYQEVLDHVGNRASVLNVIDPVVDYIAREEDTGHLGIIGTKATINSNSYPVKISEKKPELQVSSMSTPLFVPMIEEGFIFDDISNAIIRSYLSRKEMKDINTLILGCTHYPIIRNQISRYFNFDVNVLDTPRIVAEELKVILNQKGLLNRTPKGIHEFYVSDHTDSFETIANMFFGEKINLKKIEITKK